MKVTIFGAAGAVTGSCHLVEAAGKRILLDCGMIQGSKTEEAKNALPFDFDVNSIDAVVLIGKERLPKRGRFSMRLNSGVEATGFVVDGHEVIDFRAWHAGKPLPVSTWAYVMIAEAIPSVAGGPADPAAWDQCFGSLDSFSAGAGEVEARKRKAEELDSKVAALYVEVRQMRAAKKRDAGRLKELLGLAKDEPLLREEIEEQLNAN